MSKLTVTLSSLPDVEKSFVRLAELDAEIIKHRNSANVGFAALLKALTPTVSPLEEEMAIHKAAIEKWANDDADSKSPLYFTKDRRTLELAGGVIAFRKNPASVVLRKGKKPSQVIEALKKAAKSIRDACIKEPEPTLDKTAVKKLWEAGELDDDTLKDYGLQVVDDKETLTVIVKTIDSYKHD